VAEKLARDLHGRIKIEDAGFDWKVLGPDVSKADLDYVAWTCDQVRAGPDGGGGGGPPPPRPAGKEEKEGWRSGCGSSRRPSCVIPDVFTPLRRSPPTAALLLPPVYTLQDAYACSGQKCSAQSVLFAHKNWVKAGACCPYLVDLACRLEGARGAADGCAQQSMRD
jgi:hypothetical protein